MSEKMLKITFERGGVVYADLLYEQAPKTVAAIVATLPRRDKVYHAQYSASVVFTDSGIKEIEKENPISKKVPGYLSLTLGEPIFTGKCIHFWYHEYNLSKKDENFFAIVHADCMNPLEAAGFRVFHEGPEYATFELVEG